MKDKNSNIVEVLQKIGLNRHEALTYVALLDMEAVSIRKVADKSGINRGTTYEALKSLTNFGLVSVRRSGQREYFSAESPEKIFDIIQDKRKDLWQVQQSAKEMVPALLAKNARPSGRPVVRYYEDDEGIVTILKDVLVTCRNLDDPVYYAYSSRPLRQYLYRKFPQFTDKRVNEGVSVKVIAIGEGGETAEASERKWLPEPKDGGISSYSIIYGNKVAIISISSDFTPYGVVVEDAAAAAMQKLLFEQLWNTI